MPKRGKGQGRGKGKGQGKGRRGQNKGKNLTPYQGKRRVYGYFDCANCGRFWESGFSWANCGQDCKGCGCHVYPYRQTELLKTFIGYYECDLCQETWEEEFNNDDYFMSCPNCDNPDIEPYEWEDLKDHRDPNKQHLSQYCDKCKQLGYSCTKEHQRR